MIFKGGQVPLSLRLPAAPSRSASAEQGRQTGNQNNLTLTVMKKKFHFIDLVLMLPAVIALIYGFVSTI
jgi:hypothetical protein